MGSLYALAVVLVYRCTVGGVTTYSDRPCAPEAFTYRGHRRVSITSRRCERTAAMPDAHKSPTSAWRQRSRRSTAAAACDRTRNSLRDVASECAGLRLKQGERLRERKAKMEQQRRGRSAASGRWEHNLPRRTRTREMLRGCSRYQCRKVHGAAACSGMRDAQCGFAVGPGQDASKQVRPERRPAAVSKGQRAEAARTFSRPSISIQPPRADMMRSRARDPRERDRRREPPSTSSRDEREYGYLNRARISVLGGREARTTHKALAEGRSRRLLSPRDV